MLTEPNSEEWFTFDPAVLVDDDGRIWLYTGSSQPENGQYGHEIKGCFVMELAADMLTVISKPKILLPAKWYIQNRIFLRGHPYGILGNGIILFIRQQT